MNNHTPRASLLTTSCVQQLSSKQCRTSLEASCHFTAKLLLGDILNLLLI